MLFNCEKLLYFSEPHLLFEENFFKMENNAEQMAAVSAEIQAIKAKLQAAEQKVAEATKEFADARKEFADAKKEFADAKKECADATKNLEKAVTKKDLQKYTTLYNGSVGQLSVVGVQLQVVGVQLKSLQDKELKLIDVEQLRINLAHSDLKSNFPLVREASVLSQSSICGHEVKMKALEYYGLKVCAVDGYVCQLIGDNSIEVY